MKLDEFRAMAPSILLGTGAPRKEPPPYADYRAALVLSRAGLTPNQEDNVRHLVKAVLRLGGAGPDGHMQLLVFAVKVAGSPNLPYTAQLLSGLTRSVRDLRVRVVDALPAQALGFCVGTDPWHSPYNLDEVWCCPSDRQTANTNSVPWAVYEASRSLPHQRACAFKLIPPWQSPPPEPPAPKTKRPQALKGW